MLPDGKHKLSVCHFDHSRSIILMIAWHQKHYEVENTGSLLCALLLQYFDICNHSDFTLMHYTGQRWAGLCLSNLLILRGKERLQTPLLMPPLDELTEICIHTGPSDHFLCWWLLSFKPFLFLAWSSLASGVFGWSEKRPFTCWAWVVIQ